MARLPILSGREVLKILDKNRFVKVGQSGSHVRMKKITPEKAYIAIVPMHNEIPIGTLKSIIRQSGLSEDEFRNR